MNVQISWAMRPGDSRRGEMLRWLGLLMSVLGYLSRYGCGHVLQEAGNLSYAVGRQKSPVLLRWSMAYLMKVPVSKPATEVSSPESQIRRVAGGFLHVFASSVKNTTT